MTQENRNKIYLLLGSNVGDKQANISKAAARLSERVGTVINASAYYVSEPWGVKDQDEFLNQALELDTDLDVRTLMSICKEIEQELEREHIEKWGPRTIDIDIIFYNRDVVHEEGLKVPHPAMSVRKFVLEPLVEINKDFIHPILNYSLAELLEECSDQCKVSKFKSN